MDAKLKLKRFCFLGSFEPVYVHLRKPVNVKAYWPIIQQLVTELDDTTFVTMISGILQNAKLIRKDEIFMVYAAYLASNVDVKFKTAVRQVFPILLPTDADLFLFCKYAALISVEQNRKIFSKTVRKAITLWYDKHSPEELQTMWLEHRGMHGFTHKNLIKLCHIKDDTIGSSEVVLPFFKTCTDILNENNIQVEKQVEKPSTSSNSSSIGSGSGNGSGNGSGSGTPTEVSGEPHTGSGKTKPPNAPTPTNVIVAMAKLRTTTVKHEAIKIIRKFKLPYSQVPAHLLCHPVIMEAVLPTMSYLQILKCWRKMARLNHFKNAKTFKICQKMLENNDFAKKNSIHPIHLLMSLRSIAINDKKKLPTKRIEMLKLDYLENLYNESFNWHTHTGKLRMHITINLQTNYKKKMLKNHKKRLSYYDACRALSFGFLKREAKVDIFHWYEEKLKLKQIKFRRNCTTESGMTQYDAVKNSKNKQRLIAPIMNALASGKFYDVFLCIVPTAGRGNPKQNSDFLSKWLDKYRETKNPKARLIILDLLKYKRSMKYSEYRSENILEICGLDEHTIDLIYNFAHHRFD